jgi:DNA-binding NarL/FixJ family response regulator
MKITVLLVDDHKIVREGTRQLLALHTDIEVIGESSDGREAVEMAGQIRPDVVVMDVRLPQLNGIEATRIITSRYKKIKVLILSAYDDDSYVFPLIEAGASGYLLKNSSGSELAEAIRAVNRDDTALSPHISTKLIKHLNGRHVYRKENMLDGLTVREMDVLRAAAYGQANKAIAVKLGISVQTVQVHLRNIYSKLQVNNRSEAVACAIQYGWISLERKDE